MQFKPMWKSLWLWWRVGRLLNKKYRSELKDLNLNSCEIAGRTYYMPNDLAKLKALNLKYGRT